MYAINYMIQIIERACQSHVLLVTHVHVEVMYVCTCTYFFLQFEIVTLYFCLWLPTVKQ